jgi:branched-chain amino acid transport system ATP-binding protein
MARTFQVTRLFQGLTVVDNLLLACEALDRRKFAMHQRLMAQADLVQRAGELLREFGLHALESEIVRNLSYGDQRKLEVALSMAGRPRLLLLDEPMAGLSLGEGAAMHAILRNLDAAIAVLLIEHDMDVALEFAERVTVMYQGSVLASGTRDEVRANPRVQEIYLGRSDFNASTEA